MDPLEERRPPLLPQLVVVMQLGQEDDHPYFLFHGRMGDDPNSHIYEFLTRRNSNNARTEAHILSIFPSTLVDHAKTWFQRQP